jgi:hypothetical protein
MEIARPSPFDKLQRKKTRLRQQPARCSKELAIEVGDVVKKVGDDAPDRFPGVDVLLPANMTEFSM